MVAGPLVSLVGITKNFGGVHALKGVDLSIHQGEVVALVGHNGAGKSVLVQILSGVFPPSSGEITSTASRSTSTLRPMRAATPSRRSIRRWRWPTISTRRPIFFSAASCGRRFGFLDKKRMAKRSGRALAELNPTFIDIERPVRQMSGGQRQAIAIARAIHFNVRVLIMDEPTASLGPHETAQVGALIRRLRDQRHRHPAGQPRRPRRASASPTGSWS